MMFGQTSAIQGKVIDRDTKEPIPFANIVLENRGSQIGGTMSDFDGNYQIKPIPPGSVDLKATFVGYKSVFVRGITIGADRIRFFDIEMEATAETLETVEVIDYKVPLIDKDQTASGATITADEIAKMPNRNANAVATTVGGVFSQDGERGSVRGARGDATATFIDGVRVIGNSAVPQSAIEQVDVILGGVPARYGDATSGIINVTTKGPARQFGAGVEMETSQFLDAFGHNRVGFNVMGPLIKGKNTNNTSLLGFFLAGDFNFNNDGNPTAIGYAVPNDQTMNFIEQNPLRPSGSGTGTFLNSEFMTNDNLDFVKVSPNTSNQNYNVLGNINIRTTETINLTIGGSYNYFKSNAFNYNASLANSDKNTVVTNSNYRGYVRFSQRFPNFESTSNFRNFFYSIQFDYTKDKGDYGDPYHGDDVFKYGYLGKFTTYMQPTFELGSDSVDGKLFTNVWLLNSWNYDTLVTWEAPDFNPLVAEYTNNYFDIYAGQPIGNFQNLDQILLGGGLLNGSTPQSIYTLYQSPGTNQSGYGYYDNEQYNIRVDASMDIGNHAIKLGFQYEQRVANYINYGTTGLWNLMRGLTNFHIQELDKDNPQLVSYDGRVDTILYFRNYDEGSQRTFDQNLRVMLGLPVDGLDYIQTDSYDYNDNTMVYYDKDGVQHTATLNGDLNIGMFSPDELWNNGTNSLINYSGYSYTGEKLSSQPTFSDFFYEQDENGMYTRPVGAFRPIYVAGYIQDQFAYKDLIFNIGVRVDRYDANQEVLVDPFVLFPAQTVGMVNELQGNEVSHPSNMGSNYVVYVDRVNDPTRIVGYRNEYVWYNAAGIEIFDPYALDVGYGISPMLQDPNQTRVSEASFKDYDPQINVSVNESRSVQVILDGDWKFQPVAELIGNKFYVFDLTKNDFSSIKRPKIIGASTPTTLFNGMINPLTWYSVKGAIWYQGEANVGRAEQYSKIFPLMIQNWRDAWGIADFPFYFVQIAPYVYGGVDSTESAYLRESQEAALRLSNTGMAVTLDIATVMNIHPPYKKEVGERLANLALAKDYGREVKFQGPMYKSMAVDEKTIKVQFYSIEEGLKAKDGKLSELRLRVRMGNTLKQMQG